MRTQRAGRRIGSFDRTYEGLKRLKSRTGKRPGKGAFDRTYEGLKRKPATAPTRPKRPAFDRTYEGLKPLGGEPVGVRPGPF